MQSWFTFELDGEICRIEGDTADQTLAEFLSNLDSLYAHYSQGNPWLGGKPVLIAENLAGSPRIRSVDAHLLMLPMVAGMLVWTPEGIANLEPNHVVVKFLKNQPLECGQSKQNALLALFFEGYYRPDFRRFGQMEEQFDSVVSRTADFASIRDVGSRLFAYSETMRHQASQRLSEVADQKEVWTGNRDIFKDRFTKPLFLKKEIAPIDYVDKNKKRFLRPDSLPDLLRLIGQNVEFEMVAGGTNLFENRSAEKESKNYISLEAVAELQLLVENQVFWEIGAAVNLTRVNEAISGEIPAFAKAMSKFASRPVRNRATLGGYLATASDSGQLAPLLMALDTRVKLVSVEGDRSVPIRQFYLDGGGTVIRQGEFIQSVLIPRCNRVALNMRGMTTRLCDTYTVGPRRSLCSPWVTGAFAVELRENVVAEAWIAYSGIGSRPVRARKTEAFFAGKPWNEETLLHSLNYLYQEIDVKRNDYGHAPPDYRKQLVLTMIQKFYYQHPQPTDQLPIDQGVTRNYSSEDRPFFDSLS